MTDLRQRVEEDRGLLKKIQLHIPGFAGYRRREDLRVADNMLRHQVADAIIRSAQRLESVREEMVANYRVKELEPLGAVLLRMKEFEGSVRHAEGGYSGFMAHIEIKEAAMNRVYEYDLALLEGVQALGTEADRLTPMIADDKADLRGAITTVKRRVEELKETFRKRMAVATNTEVA